MTVRIESAARVEARDATRYYNGQKAGLGRRFYTALRRAISQIVEHPEAHPVVSERRGIRRKTILEFPYNVFYIIRDNVIVIVAIAHHSRRPDYWDDRL